MKIGNKQNTILNTMIIGENFDSKFIYYSLGSANKFRAHLFEINRRKIHIGSSRDITQLKANARY